MSNPEIEAQRLHALAELDILDTPSEPAFDQLTDLAQELFNVPIALISLVDKERQWFKSCIGLDVNSTPRDVAFCDIAIRTDEVMVVADASLDARFQDNRLVTGAPHIRFYAGAPVRYNGVMIGTMCVIDTVARPDFGASEALRLKKLAATASSLLLMRKNAQANLEAIRGHVQARKKLEMMEEVAGVGYWHVDLNTEEVVWSKGVYAIHGFSPESYKPDLKTAVEWYHPEDRKVVTETLDHMLATGEPAAFELRLVRADGAERRVYGQGSVSYDSAGVAATLFGVFTDVTDRCAAQAQIEASEARYRLLADNANDLVLQCHINGTVAYASPSAKRLTGYESDVLIGRKWCELLHPGDSERIPVAIRQFAEAGLSTPKEPLVYRFIHPDHGERRFEGRPTLISDRVSGEITGYVTIIRDVTESVLAKERLEASEAQLRALANHVPGKVAYWGTDLKCRFANQRYKDWYSRSADDVMDIPILDFMGAEAFKENEGYILSALAGTQSAFERTRVRPSGEVAHLWGQYIPDFAADGTVAGFYVLATDVTALKLKEFDLAQTNEQLSAARHEAETALEIKAQFLATMSHEIRTPLTTILGYAVLLSKKEDVSEETGAFIKRIGKAGRNLLSLVNDVLDVSRLEAGEVTLSPRPVNVRALTQDIVDQFSLTATSSSLQLSLQYAEDLPDWQLVDDTRLTQVLNNLIGNACKFTSDGAVTVNMRAVCGELGPRLHVEISDPGPGLTAPEIERLFKRFQQLDAGTTRKHGGSGLGLAICREIINLMSGEIGVVSDVAKGSTFWFEIPLTTAVPTRLDHEAPFPNDYSLGECKVLLVDDHAVNRQMIKAFITSYVAEVIEAADGSEAIALCRDTRFDLVFMDIQMPVIDGVEAAKAIRLECSLNKTTPIVALTAMAKSRLPAHFLGSLFDQVLTKPIDPRKFHSVLAALPEREIAS